jgi:hypothetical protein
MIASITYAFRLRFAGFGFRPIASALRETSPQQALQLTQEEVEAIQAAIAEIEHNAPESCGQCGQPNASCDCDCAAAATCAKNVGILRELLRKAVPVT